MIKALVPFRKSGILERGQHSLEFHENQAGIQHPALGASGMNGRALHRHHCGSRIEIFVFNFPQGASVHGIGEIRTKSRHVKGIRSASYFLIRREGDPYLAVRPFGVQQEGGCHIHDFRHTGLVVRAKQGSSIRHDQVLAQIIRQFGKNGGGKHHSLFRIEQDVSAVVRAHDAGLHSAAGDSRSRIHMGHPADDGNIPLHVGRDGGVNNSGIIIQFRLRSHVLQFPGQQPGQLRLAGGGWHGGGIRVRLRAHGDILQKTV